MDTAVRNESLNLFKRIIVAVLKISVSLGYSSFFVYVLFFARRRRNLTQRIFNIVPLNSTFDNFKNLPLANNRELFNFYSNLIGNIILFVPLPSLFFFLFQIKSRKNIFLVTFSSSIAIELIQYIFKRGVADIDDIFLNSFGALIGLIFIKKDRNLKPN